MWVKPSSQQSWRNQRECVLLTHNSTHTAFRALSLQAWGRRAWGWGHGHANMTRRQTAKCCGLKYDVDGQKNQRQQRRGGKRPGWGRGKWAWRVPEMSCRVERKKTVSDRGGKTNKGIQGVVYSFQNTYEEFWWITFSCHHKKKKKIQSGHQMWLLWVEHVAHLFPSLFLSFPLSLNGQSYTHSITYTGV